MVLAVEEVEKICWLIREAVSGGGGLGEGEGEGGSGGGGSSEIWLVGRLDGIQAWVSDLGRLV